MTTEFGPELAFLCKIVMVWIPIYRTEVLIGCIISIYPAMSLLIFRHFLPHLRLIHVASRVLSSIEVKIFRIYLFAFRTGKTGSSAHAKQGQIPCQSNMQNKFYHYPQYKIPVLLFLFNPQRKAYGGASFADSTFSYCFCFIMIKFET